MARDERPLEEILPHYRPEIWVSRPWAAQALGVSRRSVERMLRSGELRGQVSEDGRITVSVASIIEAGGAFEL